MKCDEKELIRLASKGDREAFGDLYIRYLDRIYRYLFYRVGRVAEAEDLTEKVFLKAWESIRRYKHRGCFSSWLYRIARNMVIDYYRSEKPTLPLKAERLNFEAENLTPEEALAKEEEVRNLRKAIAKLPEEQQQVIILRFLEGLSHAEIAEIIGKSEGASRVIQHRALTALKEILEREEKR